MSYLTEEEIDFIRDIADLPGEVSERDEEILREYFSDVSFVFSFELEAKVSSGMILLRKFKEEFNRVEPPKKHHFKYIEHDPIHYFTLPEPKRYDIVSMYIYCVENGRPPQQLSSEEISQFEVSDEKLKLIKERNQKAYELLRKVQDN